MKETFKKVIKEFHESELPKTISRGYSLKKSDEITTLIGIRRSGKTYLFFQKIEELKARGVDLERIVFINFEDERLVGLKSDELQLIFEAYYELYPKNTNKKLYLFFDEVHAAPKWSLFLKRLYEKKEHYIFVTGSSSKILSKEIATELRGRTISKFVYPLSFKEFLRFKDFDLDKNIEFSKNKFKLKKFFDEYIRFGAFPQVALSDNNIRKEEILSTYLELIIYKDLIERYSIRNIGLLKELVKYFVTNISKKFSLNNFYKTIKKNTKVAKDTVWEYFSYLEDIGFFYVVPKFSFSLKKQLSTSKKIYLCDLGFKRIFGFNFSQDMGRFLENLVLIQLIRTGKEIYYYKEKHECDFIIKEKDKIVRAIQVTKEINKDNKKREINGLLEAMEKFDLKKGLILTYDQKDKIKTDGKIITVKPVWEWILNQ